jgi:hypothetical protein
MKNNYREKIAELIERAYPKLSATHRFEFKNVFGAVKMDIGLTLSRNKPYLVYDNGG